jgi:hypothetical protein
MWRMAEAKFTSGSGPMRICTKPTLYFRLSTMTGEFLSPK